MEDSDYVAVRFEGNGSRKWDGREIEVPEKTVVRLGQRTAEGLEKAEVLWPGKGKSKGKVWTCVMLPVEVDSDADASPPAKRPAIEVDTAGASSSATASNTGGGSTSITPTRPSRGKWRLEQKLREWERESAASGLTAAVEKSPVIPLPPQDLCVSGRDPSPVDPDHSRPTKPIKPRHAAGT